VIVTRRVVVRTIADFRTRLEWRLIELGIDYAELCRRLGMPKSAVSKALARESMDEEFLARVTEALDDNDWSVDLPVRYRPLPRKVIRDSQREMVRRVAARYMGKGPDGN